MNRKNTILVAVMVNAGLLAVLFIAALTGGGDVPERQMMATSDQMTVPQFDDQPLFEEPVVVLPEIAKAPILEIPVTEAVDPLVHKLPQLTAMQEAPVVIAQPAAPTPAPSMAEIVVKKGDTLEKIAKANKTTVGELAKFNQLPSSFLKVGQVLKIPVERTLAKAMEKKPVEKKTAAITGPEYYTMKVGENPWAIAMKHHMKVDELLKLNGLNEEKARKLKPGDRLRIR